MLKQNLVALAVIVAVFIGIPLCGMQSQNELNTIKLEKELVMQSSQSGMQTLLTGLGFGESPRWHNGRLWFSNWGKQEVVAVNLKGKSEIMARVPTSMPFSIDWLPISNQVLHC